MDAYHPSNYFKVNPAGFTPFLIGTGGTQSLAHILNMTSTMDDLEGKKSSLFFRHNGYTKTGVSQGDFTNNFSNNKHIILFLMMTLNLK